MNRIEYSGRKVFGYAAVFDQPSRMLLDTHLSDEPFREVIQKGAITDETLFNSKVVAVINHKPEKGVFAEWNKGEGSLLLRVDDRGLYFEFEAPTSEEGDKLLRLIEQGETVGCSFSYLSNTAEFTTEFHNGEKFILINKIAEIADVTVATIVPAYGGTSVSKRTMMDTKEELLKQIEELKLKVEAIDENSDRTAEEEKPTEEPKEEENKPSEEPKEEEPTETPEEPKEEPESPKNEEKEASERTEEEPKEEEKPAEEEIPAENVNNTEDPKEEEEPKENRTINNTNMIKEINENSVLEFTKDEKKEYNLRTLSTDSINSKESFAAEAGLIPGTALDKLGCRYVRTGKTSGSFPIYNAPEAVCLAEGAEVATAGAGEPVEAYQHRIAVMEVVPEEMVADNGANYLQVVVDTLNKKVYEKLEKMAFGCAVENHAKTGSAQSIGGLANVIGGIKDAASQVGTEVDYKVISGLVAEIADKGDNNVKILTSNVGKNLLDNMEIGSGSFIAAMANKFDIVPTGNVGKANVGTAAAPKNNPLAIMGDFSKLAVVQFGDIHVDVFYKGSRHAYEVTVNADFDVIPTQKDAFKAIILGKA